MASPTSFRYFGSQAGQDLDQAASQFLNGFDRIRAAINALGNIFRSASYGLRKEVPFERWFFDYGFQTPIDSIPDLMKVRFWAVLAAGEGVIRTTTAIVSLVYSKVFCKDDSAVRLDILKAQWLGFTLSLLAIVSPNSAKSVADNQGQPLIGCSIFDWKWGNLYTGKMNVSLFQPIT